MGKYKANLGPEFAEVPVNGGVMTMRRMLDDDVLKSEMRRVSIDIDKQGKRILNEWSVHNFRQVPIWLGYVNGDPVTVHISHLGSRKNDVWTPYLNQYVMYTHMHMRRRGYARAAYQYVRELAINSGCLRVKSQAGTYLGLLVHVDMGDQIWGWTHRNTLAIDTPLVDPSRFPPDTTPIYVRQWTQRTQPMTADEIAEAAKTGTFVA